MVQWATTSAPRSPTAPRPVHDTGAELVAEGELPSAPGAPADAAATAPGPTGAPNGAHAPSTSRWNIGPGARFAPRTVISPSPPWLAPVPSRGVTRSTSGADQGTPPGASATSAPFIRWNGAPTADSETETRGEFKLLGSSGLTTGAAWLKDWRRTAPSAAAVQPVRARAAGAAKG
eukprot:1194381-Prorocentrum_minimum.AAC.7